MRVYDLTSLSTDVSVDDLIMMGFISTRLCCNGHGFDCIIITLSTLYCVKQTQGEADACSAMSLSKTPDPPFFAPRSGVLDKPVSFFYVTRSIIELRCGCGYAIEPYAF